MPPAEPSEPVEPAGGRPATVTAAERPASDLGSNQRAGDTEPSRPPDEPASGAAAEASDEGRLAWQRLSDDVTEGDFAARADLDRGLRLGRMAAAEAPGDRPTGQPAGPVRRASVLVMPTSASSATGRRLAAEPSPQHLEPPSEPESEEDRRAGPSPRDDAPQPEAAPEQEAENIGVPPPREQPQFLRNDSVLLKPGEYQWEIGVSYAHNSRQTPIGQFSGEGGFVGNIRRVNRVMQMPLEVRIGLTPDWQASVALPIGWANQELSLGGADQFSNLVGVGDLNLSLTRLLRKGDLNHANVLGMVALSMPTGESTFATSLQDPAVALGRGFYSLTTGITAIRTIDPIVFFLGFGYQHNFETSFANIGRMDPGNGGFYRLGIGYAVNPRVSLSAVFTGAYLGDARIEGDRLGGSSREPLAIRIAATVINQRQATKWTRATEPFVTLGLNDDAADSVFGIAWTF